MIAIYVRVSTQEQALNGHSIDEQIDRLTKYCDAMNWNYKIYTDAGYSGSNIQRPALQQLIKEISVYEKVLVYKLDRLSRSQKDTLYLIEDVFLKSGCDFVSMNENFDTSSPFGRAMIGILAVFAQLEREQIKERMTMGKFARAKQGFYSSSKAPIGYDYVNGELVTNEFEKMQIKAIFEAYSQGKSPKTIVKDLNDAGYHHKYGSWQIRTVRQLLGSKIYLGFNRYHDEWYQSTHEPFITQELYDQVQTILQKKSDDAKLRNRRTGKATSYLGGFLYCGECGAKYSKQVYQVRKKDGWYKYPKYVCNSRSKKTPHLIHDPNCKNKNWKMEELDEIVFSEIRKLAFADSFEQNEEVTDLEPIKAEIGKIESQIAKLIDLYAVGDMPVQLLQDKIQNLNQQKSNLESQLSKPKPEITHDMIRNMAELLEHCDFEETRTIISELIDKIVLEGDDVTIYWNL